MNKTLRIVLALGCSVVFLSGCEDLLEVDLPARLGDSALEDPVGAETIRNSLISEFETAFNYILWSHHGLEDGGEIILGSPGIDRGGFDWQVRPQHWFPYLQSARRFAAIFHEKLEKEWTVAQVPRRAQFMATASMFEAAAIGLMGMTLCEVTVGGGKMLKADEALALADQVLTRAITEVGAVGGGDFAIPYGVASSAKALAYAFRAQVRWMKGDATAAQDAAQVPKGFMAYATREAGLARRNKAYFDGTLTRYAYLFPVNDWWVPDPTKRAGSNTNPVTGKPWPTVLPFTGYAALGILPDGRAVRDDGLPIRTDGKYRTPIESTAVPDTRVRTQFGITQGQSFPNFIVNKYQSEGEDLPLVNWREMWLIRAQLAGGQQAIDLVNEVRVADNLPRVTYITGATATPEQIRYMIIEERRRALFIEGRYYFTKLENLDLLWFPRNDGRQPSGRNSYGGAVRMIMPLEEYDLNPNLSRSDQATGCPVHERPVDF